MKHEVVIKGMDNPSEIAMRFVGKTADDLSEEEKHVVSYLAGYGELWWAEWDDEIGLLEIDLGAGMDTVLRIQLKGTPLDRLLKMAESCIEVSGEYYA